MVQHRVLAQVHSAQSLSLGGECLSRCEDLLSLGIQRKHFGSWCSPQVTLERSPQYGFQFTIQRRQHRREFCDRVGVGFFAARDAIVDLHRVVDILPSIEPPLRPLLVAQRSQSLANPTHRSQVGGVAVERLGKCPGCLLESLLRQVVCADRGPVVGMLASPIIGFRKPPGKTLILLSFGGDSTIESHDGRYRLTFGD